VGLAYVVSEVKTVAAQCPFTSNAYKYSPTKKFFCTSLVPINAQLTTTFYSLSQSVLLLVVLSTSCSVLGHLSSLLFGQKKYWVEKS